VFGENSLTADPKGLGPCNILDRHNIFWVIVAPGLYELTLRIGESFIEVVAESGTSETRHTAYSSATESRGYTSRIGRSNLAASVLCLEIRKRRTTARRYRVLARMPGAWRSRVPNYSRSDARDRLDTIRYRRREMGDHKQIGSVTIWAGHAVIVVVETGDCRMFAGAE